jgi:hypothetical protein
LTCGGTNETATLRLDDSNATVTTKKDGGVNVAVVAGLRHNNMVSDFHELLRQADATKRSDWLAADDEKKEPTIEIRVLPVSIVANPEEVPLKTASEEMGAGYEKYTGCSNVKGTPE